MFFVNFFKRDSGQSELELARSLSTHPRDVNGEIVFLDDVVIYNGLSYDVVAMSHKNKVVVRHPSQHRGGRWVDASKVEVRFHASEGALA